MSQVTKIVIDDGVTELDDLVEEIRLRQETSQMPWTLAIKSILERYVVSDNEEDKQ